MTVTPAQRRYKNRTRSARRSRWYINYRARMDARLERCRRCCRDNSDANPLTFDHIVPHAQGGRFRFNNVTILCERCNKEKSDNLWPDLMSLAAEEAIAYPRRRWSQLSLEEALRRPGILERS